MFLGSSAFSLQRRMRQNMEFLTSKRLGGRVTGTGGFYRASMYVYDELHRAGLQPMRQHFDFQCRYRPQSSGTWARGENVFAAIRSENKNAKTIVVGAHMDGVGYPAANDNASGTVALLALASRLQLRSWNHHLLLVAFGGEEQGLCGSQYFVAQSSTENFKYMINLDMVGQSLRKKGRPVYVLGDDEHPELRAAFRAHDANALFGSFMRLPYEWSSDHRSFHDVGVPSVLLIGGNNEDHHKSTDTPDKIEYDYMERIVNLVVGVVSELDKSPQ
jgi:Zn-dependent M28 family amino/carboxypeptidase